MVLTRIQDAAAEVRMNMVLGTIPVDPTNTPTDLAKRLLIQPLDGVLLVGSHRPETIAAVLDLMTDQRPPVVLVDSGIRRDELDSVVSDNLCGTYTATRDLIDLGHRHLACFGSVSTWDLNFQLRCEGFWLALRESGLEPIRVPEVNSVVQGTPTPLHHHPTLSQLIDDATANIATGREDISALDVTIKAWQVQGGNTIRAEYEAALASYG